MKISPGYIEQNQELHARGNYGISGWKWAQAVRKLSEDLGTRDILDYGCGRRSLEQSLGFPIHNYDPCIPGLDAPPQPHDIVACTDVLEHIEPDCLDAVLDDLQRVTRKAGFFVIANGPAQKFLPDGRNAHLIQEGIEWWAPKLEARFAVESTGGLPQEMVIVVRPRVA